MMRDTAVDVYYPVSAKNAQGIVAQTWTYFKTIEASFQPRTLTESQAQAWGVSVQAADAKWIAYENDESIRELYRAKVDGYWYDMRGINKWPGHAEALLIPVSGAKVESFCVSLDPIALPNMSYVWVDSASWGDAGRWIDG